MIKQDFSTIYKWHSDLEKELSDHLSKQMQEEIDWEILCAMLKEVGWSKVCTSWDCQSVEEAYELKEWCKKHIKGHYKARGKTWIFELEKDASMFIMKWA